MAGKGERVSGGQKAQCTDEALTHPHERHCIADSELRDAFAQRSDHAGALGAQREARCAARGRADSVRAQAKARGLQARSARAKPRSPGRLALAANQCSPRARKVSQPPFTPA